MHIGIPKETDAEETRVALAPISVQTLVARGNQVFVEMGAGLSAGFDDEDYAKAGARILPSPEKLYAVANLIVKVKELEAVDLELLDSRHIVLGFHFLHAKPELLQKIIRSKTTILAYESVNEHGDAYVMRAMSEICGKIAMQKAGEAQHYGNLGRGLLLSGLPGIDAPTVAVIGAGSAGYAAAEMAVRNGNRVILFDRDQKRLETAYRLLGPHITTLPASSYHFARVLAQSDVVIGAAHLPYAKAPLTITRELLAKIPKGAVVIDLAVEQGGCVEGSRPTTLEEPYFEHDGIVHCAIPNLPAAVPKTASLALNGAIYSIVLRLAKHGFDHCLQTFSDIRAGLQLVNGRPVVAELARLSGEKLYAIDDLIVPG
jgi:alanine dehydrogenase